MELIWFQLKQFVALVVAVNLVQAMVPPSPIGEPIVRADIRVSSLAARSAVSGLAEIQSARRKVESKRRSHADSEGASVGQRARSANEVSHDKSDPKSPGSSNKFRADRKLADELTEFAAHGLEFVENKGQFDSRVKFRVSNRGNTLWLTESGIAFDFLQNKTAPLNSPSAESRLANATPSKRPITAFSKTAPFVPPDMERHIIAEDFVEANHEVVVETKSPSAGTYNYFSGSDSSKWRTNVHQYAEVVYHNLWRGIDLRLYGNGRDLKQEFIVKRGADAGQVQVAYEGIEKLEVATDGTLLIKTAAGEMKESAPRIYQEIDGRRVPVKGRFKLLTATSYAFDFDSYNAEYALVVDPTVLYSSYLGGSAGNNQFTTGNQEVANAVAVDTSGNAYITGYTLSPDFPTTVGAFATTHSPTGSYVGFVTKLNPTGSALVYSSYFNYTSFGPVGIAIDASGNAYIAGMIGFFNGPSFPLTPTAYSTCGSSVFNGTSSGFLSVLNSSGTGLLYSTCFGALGSNGVTGVAIDSKGHAFVVGEVPGSGSVPTTPNAVQMSFVQPGNNFGAAFVTGFDTNASGDASLVYSTYLGVTTVAYKGSEVRANAVAVDPFGKVYVTGDAAQNYPTTIGAFQPSFTVGANCNSPGVGTWPCPHAFVTKLDPTAPVAQSLIYSTYLEGSQEDVGTAMAVDGSGNVFVTGGTQSLDFPVTPGAFQTTLPFNLGGTGVSFIAKLNAAGSALVYSTYLESVCTDVHSCASGNIAANGIAFDSIGNAYIAGSTKSALFPVTADAFQTNYLKPVCHTDCASAFLTKLNTDGSALMYSSYLGGEGDDVATAVAVDQIGDAYVVGHTSSLGFPVTSFAFHPAVHGTGDAFVTKFSLGTNQSLSITAIAPTSGGNGGNVSPQIFGSGFHAGAIAQLNCGSAVVGTNVIVGPGGRFLNTTFNLAGAPEGMCDVVVTNPDGTSTTLQRAFSVEAGGAPSIQITLSGVAARQAAPEVALSPSKTAFFVTAQNTGNSDALGVLITAALSSGYSLAAVQPLALDSVPNMSAAGVASWSIPNLAPGQSTVFTYLGTTAPAAAFSPVPIGPVWGLPGFPPSFPLPPVLTLPIAPYPTVSEVLSCIETNVQDVDENDGQNCLDASFVCGEAAAACDSDPKSHECATSFVECEIAAAKCALTEKCVPTGSLKNPPSNGCQQISSTFIGVGGSTCITLVTPTDPNNLFGPPGVGTQGWIQGTQPLTYGISFGNEPTATAPAQQVVVNDPLGPNVKLSTLTLPIITVPNGSSVVQVPVPIGSFNPASGINEYVTNVDLRPTQNLLVNVDAKLNSGAQTLVWTFTSIDPTTGLPPLNPLVGFLPPGAGANVSFSVSPAQGLTTGTQIAEQATIVFQGAGPMSTQAWTNTIDNTAPVSQVQPLPAAENSVNFAVKWTGTDVGSGVQDFTIYVSDNSGPFIPFQTNTTATSAQFMGQTGHTYGFYSIARDLVGNIEAPKTVAEATTLAGSNLDTIPPITTVATSRQPNAAGWNNSNVTITLTAADNLGGSGVRQVSYSATGAQAIPATTINGSSASFVISTEGISTISFFSTDNAGNVEAPNMSIIRLDKTPPTISSSATPVANSNGWNNTSVTVSFNCADALSGLAAGSPPASTILSIQGAIQSVVGTCTDLAGNAASATVSGINIDTTSPAVACSASPNILWPPNNKLVPVNVSVTVKDSLSGPAGFNLVSVTSNEPESGQGDIQGFVSGSPSASGQLRAQRLGSGTDRIYTFNYSGTDRAGNAASCTATATVSHDQGK